MKTPENYSGFEIGPIRPPSEAASLLVRVTRNCPWNNCKFCGLYKGANFSMRSKADVLHDLDLVKMCIDVFRSIEGQSDTHKKAALTQLKSDLGRDNIWAYSVSTSWYRNGMKSVFLQDANSMIVKPQDMVDILLRIRELFGNIERITSYARSHTIARISDEDLLDLAEAGLNRIHIGMETASDTVLKLVNKGVDKQTHIIAGQKVKKAGIQLSEYFMPGLGGLEYSEENALETADAINQINPDYVRIRTLAVTPRSELFEDYEQGLFTRTNDIKMVEELHKMISHLNGVTTYIKSDHILNLIQEMEGQLPQDKDKILKALQWYLDLSVKEQNIYRIGRRTGLMQFQEDLHDHSRRQAVLDAIKENNISGHNIDSVVDDLMNQFI